MAKVCHPDHPEAGGTTEKFNQLKKAYDELSDPVKRHAYDASVRETVSYPQEEKKIAHEHKVAQLPTYHSSDGFPAFQQFMWSLSKNYPKYNLFGYVKNYWTQNPQAMSDFFDNQVRPNNKYLLQRIIATIDQIKKVGGYKLFLELLRATIENDDAAVFLMILNKDQLQNFAPINYKTANAAFISTLLNIMPNISFLSRLPIWYHFLMGLDEAYIKGAFANGGLDKYHELGYIFTLLKG